MEKGNVLAIGNLGVGKSTLINAVIGDDSDVKSWGKIGSASELAIYENEELNFRIIETVGYDSSFLKEQQAINSVKSWLKGKDKLEEGKNNINVIWFCVDATDKKSIPQSIEQLCKATSNWKSVPVVVLITKSYAEPEREKDMEAATVAYAKQKKFYQNFRKAIPVVASTYMLNENAFAPPEGITELIDITNELMPEGLQVAEKSLDNFKLNQKRTMAHGLVVAATSAAALVGAVPIPFPDALILTPIEAGLIGAIGKTYEIKKDIDSEKFFNTLIEMGTVGVIAKSAITAMKAIPGINLGASVINAIVAGAIVATIGEGAIYSFEQIHLGKKSILDTSWLNEVMESKQLPQIMGIIESATKKIDNKTNTKDIPKIILEIVGENLQKRGKELKSKSLNN